MLTKIFDDPSHRYAPDSVIIANWDNPCGPAGWRLPVLQVISYPPGQSPSKVIRPDYTAVQLVTAKGDRWYGCERAYINSELRMVLVGHPSRDEVRQQWPIVPVELQA